MTNINQISSTGNHIVDAIGKINITGNIIPEAWYKTIQKTRKHPYLHAIILLSEIVYWYRPKEVCDEATGERTYKKKFSADLWQVSMSTLSDKFGLSKDQVRDALDFLEANVQVIKRHYRTIDSRTGKLSNVMYIELIPDVLMNLTYPEDNSIDDENIPEGSETSSNTYLEKSEEVLENSPTPIGENSNTYTENTPKNTEENNTKTTTTETACAVVYSESELSWCREVYPNFSDEALNKLLDAANGDVSKVISSSSIYNEQKTHIKYPESWIIACIKDGYYEKKTNKPTKKINHGFKERDYDWDELEYELFNQNL